MGINALNTNYFGISSGSFFSNSFGSNNSSSSSNSNLVLYKGFSEVNSIAYKRLLKEYYSIGKNNTTSEERKTTLKNNLSNTIDTTNQTALQTKELKSNAETLKDAASAITKTDENGNNVLFAKDRDEIDKSIRNFIDKYNTLVKDVADSKNDNVRIGSLDSQLTAISRAGQYTLSKAGITANSDGTLSIDEKKYKSATVETLQDVFTGKASFTERAFEKATDISKNAERYATKIYETYNQKSNYFNTLNTGNLFNSFF